MKPADLLFLPLLIACSAAAQDQPQFVWEGEVDGTNVLHVRRNRIDIEDRSGLPVQRQRFRFSESLPDRRQDVQLQLLEGRGRVRILAQPRPDNNHTLSVLIEDHQGGSSFYSLAFFWEGSGGGFFSPPPVRPRSNFGASDSVSWSGRVDGEAIVECRGNMCGARLLSGQPVTRDRFRFSRPLPRAAVQVSLEEASGRGRMQLVQQPREDNGYTAAVQIQDPQGGAGDYAFALVWVPARRGEPERLFSQRGLIWSGRVDGRIRVAVQNQSAFSEVLAGGPVGNERASFERSLPSRGNLNPTVKRLRGRGRVELVEFPGPRNNYRLVFEIDDSQGGAGDYEVEVGW